jgi:hypothetical protein
MRHIVDDDVCVQGEYPIVQSFKNSQIFYETSITFENNRRVIGFSGGLKCRQCGNKSRHSSQSAYCYIHKRIVDMNETCPNNTCDTYKNVNMPR